MSHAQPKPLPHQNAIPCPETHEGGKPTRVAILQPGAADVAVLLVAHDVDAAQLLLGLLEEVERAGARAHQHDPERPARAHGLLLDAVARRVRLGYQEAVALGGPGVVVVGRRAGPRMQVCRF